MRTAPVRRRRRFTRPGRSGPHASVSTLLCPRVASRPKRHVSSDQGNSREQSCAVGTAQWRGLRGAFLHVHGPHRRQAGVRGPRHPPGRPPSTFRRTAAQVRRTPRISPRPTRNPCKSAVFQPWGSPEKGPRRPPTRRRSIPESSCGTPMHAASLTKGYGGNPPSGRSVSPPRTGPFFVFPGLLLGEWRCGGSRLSPPGTAIRTGSARRTPGPRAAPSDRI